MTLLGLAGYKGSGKSVVAHHLVEEHGFVRLPLAAVLKDMLCTFGLTEAQVRGDEKEIADHRILCGKTPRWAMQSLGTEWGRDCIGTDVWTQAWWMKALPILDLGGSVVADDVRFGNEANMVVNKQGFIARVERPGFEPTPEPLPWWRRVIGQKPRIHPSERLDFEVDYWVYNQGSIDQLRYGTDRLLAGIRRWETGVGNENLLDGPRPVRAS